MSPAEQNPAEQNPAEQQHLKFPLCPGKGGNLNDVAAEQGKRGAKFEKIVSPLGNTQIWKIVVAEVFPG